jgi:hypothetical protein
LRQRAGKKNVFGSVSIDLAPYRGDKQVGMRHTHPGGAGVDTTGGHAVVAANVFPDAHWLDNQTFTIYTSLSSGLVYQRYTELSANSLSGTGEDTPPLPVP